MVHSLRYAAVLSVAVIAVVTVVLKGAPAPADLMNADVGLDRQVLARIAAAFEGRTLPRGRAVGAMSPGERRAAVDAYWGQGPSTAEKLRNFDTFWEYVDRKFAAFQHIDVDWAAVRAQYRPEVEAGVTRGRFAAIINQMSLALRDSHTIPLDLLVNVFTVPEPGVPLMGVSGWIVDTSGACLTAQGDGSALVYSAAPNHPLGLQRGDRILGYEGRPWRELYQQLLSEELPLWPLWWGSTPSSFEHTFVMSAGVNWHLFDTMDVAKAGGGVVHLSTSSMPGAIFWGVCSEQLPVPGVPRPTFFDGGYVSAGVVEGTRVGYIYSWSWAGNAVEQFAEAVNQLTQVEHVEGLVLDFRFNEGGFLSAPFRGLSALSSRPEPTVGMDQRASRNHFDMKALVTPSQFTLDFDHWADAQNRVRPSFTGPIAVLIGPGAVSAGDYGALWATYLPNVRTFGKSTSMAVGLPTQPALGTSLNLGPNWFARIAETNTYRVGMPKDFLIHTEFPVETPVWLEQADVAAGRDTVVEAALGWLRGHIGH